ncbi:MAG: PP2C family protein-serine/threonine phosphatase [bacterium]
MSENKFRVNLRFAQFGSSLKFKDIISLTFIGYSLGWLLSFYLVASFVHLNFVILILLFHGYFWFKLVNEILQKIEPPAELLLILFLLIHFVDLAFLRIEFAASTFWNPVIQMPSSFLGILQIMVLALSILIFSLILVKNSQGKRGVIVWYVLLGFIGINLLRAEDDSYLLLFQFVLFILLLRKTSWLEELTKLECWTGFLLLFLLFQGVSLLDPFQGANTNQLAQQFIWYSAPFYMYLLFKIYLLALLVKIPVVLVYNHAQLSRKLRISSLFQSTFPQVIHLIMLLIIFYFFIAVWQAENVRQALINQIEQVKSGKATPSLTYFKGAKTSIGSTIFYGYQPINLSNELPQQGILALERAPSGELADYKNIDYFFFFDAAEVADDSVYFFKINSNFLASVTENMSVLAGTQLLSYPYLLAQWETFIYNRKILMQDNEIRIFPFSLTPQKSANFISVGVEAGTKPRYAFEERRMRLEDAEINFGKLDENKFTVGRVLVPLWNANFEHVGDFAFDVLLVPSLSIFNSLLFRYIVFFIIVYLLVNLFVVRRAVKFGARINRRIVQKFNQLKDGIREISSGNLDYKVKLEGEDEFVELAERFNQMGEKLKQTIEEVREKERLEHELNIARQVQLSLLPSHLPQVQGYQVAATLKTATEVGGDFYDIIPLNNNKFLFTIGDVSGKSTSAAFYMAQCISLIRYSPQFTYEPREIILRLNEYFADPMVDRQMFVTAIVGMLDAAKSTIRLVRAGHTMPILIPGRKKEEIRELQPGGLGIGLARSGQMLEKVLKVEQVTIRSGDMVVLYTDGVVEAARSSAEIDSNNGEDEETKQFYGEERLMNLLKGIRGKSATKIMQELTNDLESFYGGNAPVDDYTLLIIQKTSR